MITSRSEATQVACALAHHACRHGFSALYLRIPRLLHDLAIARGDGRYSKLLASFAKTDLLVLDDFGIAKLNSDHRRDLLELLEDRYASRSTLVTSQLPLAQWHELLGDPTLADAILDRLVHNTYKLGTQGRFHAKTALRADPCRSLHGIITAPRRFAPSGDRLDRIR